MPSRFIIYLTAILTCLWMVIFVAMASGLGGNFQGHGIQRMMTTAHLGLIHGYGAGVYQPGHNAITTFPLEPGDLILVHDPQGAYGHYTHAGLVLDPNRIVSQNLQDGISVESTFAVSTYQEIVVLRAPLPFMQRHAIAEHASQWIGQPFALVVHKRDQRYHSCTSLAWQAWHSQGIDLAPDRDLLLPDDLFDQRFVVFHDFKRGAAAKPERQTIPHAIPPFTQPSTQQTTAP